MSTAHNHAVSVDNSQRRRDPPHSRSSLWQHIRRNRLSTLLGLIGLTAGIILIVRNEAHAVKVSKFLQESMSLVRTVSPDETVDESNIGELVQISGVLTIHEPLTEVDYGISVSAVKLLRQVQMYQWVESQHDNIDEEGITVSSSYSYYKDWQSNLIDSSLFHTSMGHWNPKEFPIKRQTQINENVKIGNYQLGLDLKKKFKNFIPITSDERPERQDIKLHAGMYYHSQNIWNPEIGDVRIQFFYSGENGKVVTIIARLDDSLTLVPYSHKSGIEILSMNQGYYTLEQMFAMMILENKLMTWLMRGAGWFLIYVSCMSLATLLQIIVSRSNFLQEVLPLSHSSMKMTASMCLSLLVTALSWVCYRPVLGVGLIFVTVPLLFFTKWFSSGGPRERYNRL